MDRERSLPGFHDQSPPDRYCDLVLTGGVTSAIAYPGVVHGLAQAYRFNAIGGSSSGAGSAALAAAAEYRRRHGSTDGFRTLLQRTAAVADDYGGLTGLAWLFQPDACSRRLFRALLPAFVGPGERLGRLMNSVICAYGKPLLGGLALGAGMTLAVAQMFHPAGSGDWVGWGVAAFFIGALVAASMLAGAVWSDLKGAANADYGLCSGQKSQPDARHLPLTPWLHALIQDIAGLPHDRPLTFADLWSAPGGPRDTLGDASPAGTRSIDLRMFTANVSLGRPLLLPQHEDEPTLYFRPSEMLRLFPREVVSAMMRHSTPCEAPAEVLEPCRGHPPPERGEAFYVLPRGELPVLVAARMSVSFPILFSAVPLWERVAAGRRFRRLLFADGGVCSNFPIHLFDSPIPAWPTFGVALHEDVGEAPEVPDEPACSTAWVHVASEHAAPPPDRWNGWDREARPLDRLLGFAGALLSTTKDWNDALLAELPGVRERIAHIALPAHIGGLNILMNRQQIEWLAMAGGEAARQLLQRFSSPGSGSAMAAGWREHRWVRFNILAECLHESLAGLSRAAQFSKYAEPMAAQIRQAVVSAPLQGAGGRPLRPAEAAALERTLEALLQIERAFTPRPLEQPYRPLPRPELRIRPPM